MEGEDLIISCNYRRGQFPTELSEYHEVEIFRDRIDGWLLSIAEQVEIIPHAGFALLYLVSSYFEMIAQYVNGEDSDGRSKEYFAKGFREVYGESYLESSRIDLLLLYKGLRCAIYHSGLPRGNIVLSGAYARAFESEGDMLKINPHILLKDVRNHFSGYIAKLLDQSEQASRDNFLKRFHLACKVK